MDKSKVRYRATRYTATGNTYYTRSQLIGEGGDTYWSDQRQITCDTYKRAERAGYTCEWIDIDKRPADVIRFDTHRIKRAR